MAEFFNRKGAKQFDASFDKLRYIPELTELLLVASGSGSRVGNTPVGDDRLSGKNRTGFFRPIANSNNDVESGIFKLIPRLAAGVVGINSVLVL